MSRGRGRRRRTLFADAVLAYQRHEEDGTALELRFLELDPATLSVLVSRGEGADGAVDVRTPGPFSGAGVLTSKFWWS